MNTTWPDPADPAAAQRLMDRFAALSPGHAAAAAHGPALAALGGNSPYLADLALRESATFMAALVDPAATLADTMTTQSQNA